MKTHELIAKEFPRDDGLGFKCQFCGREQSTVEGCIVVIAAPPEKYPELPTAMSQFCNPWCQERDTQRGKENFSRLESNLERMTQLNA